MADYNEEVNLLTKKIQELTEENDALKLRLKAYTNPSRKKLYYEKHKDEIKLKPYYGTSSYKPSKEQKQMYNKKYYEKKKQHKAELVANGASEMP